MDVSRLDFRVGKILTAKRHPDADTLFVEESEWEFCLFLTYFLVIPSLTPVDNSINPNARQLQQFVDV